MQCQTILHLQRAAENREGNDPKIGLIKCHLSANADSARMGFDPCWNLKDFFHAVKCERDY